MNSQGTATKASWAKVPPGGGGGTMRPASPFVSNSVSSFTKLKQSLTPFSSRTRNGRRRRRVSSPSLNPPGTSSPPYPLPRASRAVFPSFGRGVVGEWLVWEAVQTPRVVGGGLPPPPPPPPRIFVPLQGGGGEAERWVQTPPPGGSQTPLEGPSLSSDCGIVPAASLIIDGFNEHTAAFPPREPDPDSGGSTKPLQGRPDCPVGSPTPPRPPARRSAFLSRSPPFPLHAPCWMPSWLLPTCSHFSWPKFPCCIPCNHFYTQLALRVSMVGGSGEGGYVCE